MDWIRRNWPDLLIGLALLAVIAGIIATLLTGGSFFPLRQSGQPSNSQQRDPGNQTVVGSRTPGTNNSQSGSASESNGATGAQEGDPVDLGQLSGGQEVDGQAPGQEAGQGSSNVQVTALPLPGSEANGQASGNGQSTGELATPNSGTQATDGDSTQVTGSTQQNGAGTSDAGQTAGAVSAAAAPTASGEEAGTYRVSVGAFSSRENAERQAQTFRDAGFPVFIGEQGTLSIVLVGPFEDLNDAESTSARIRSGDYGIDPVIYRFQPDEEESGANTASASPSAAPASAATSGAAAAITEPSTPDEMQVTSSGTPAPAATAAGASGARSLQVGAYATAESAQPQIDRLESLGFRVNEVTEGTLIKLMVGPFSGDELSEAQALLNEQGIEHFAR